MGGGQFKLRRLIRQLADGKCDERRIIRFYIVGVSLLQFPGTGKREFCKSGAVQGSGGRHDAVIRGYGSGDKPLQLFHIIHRFDLFSV